MKLGSQEAFFRLVFSYLVFFFGHLRHLRSRPRKSNPWRLEKKLPKNSRIDRPPQKGLEYIIYINLYYDMIYSNIFQ